jgi:hypothetical protein
MKMKEQIKLFEEWSALNEGTRSRIGALTNDGRVKSVYIHSDGYFDGVGKDILSLNSSEAVKNRLAQGDGSEVFGGFYKDRGESGVDAIYSNSIKDYLKDTADSWGEYAYIYLPSENRWIGKKVSGDEDWIYLDTKEAVPASVLEVPEENKETPDDFFEDKEYDVYYETNIDYARIFVEEAQDIDGVECHIFQCQKIFLNLR